MRDFKKLGLTYLSSSISQLAGFAVTAFLLHRETAQASLLLNVMPVVAGTASYFLTSAALWRRRSYRERLRRQKVAFTYTAGMLLCWLVAVWEDQSALIEVSFIVLSMSLSMYRNQQLLLARKPLLAAANYLTLMVAIVAAVALSSNYVLLLPIFASIYFLKLRRTWRLRSLFELGLASISITSTGIVLAPLILYPAIEAIAAKYVFSSAYGSGHYLGISRLILGATNFFFSGAQIAAMTGTRGPIPLRYTRISLLVVLTFITAFVLLRIWIPELAFVALLVLSAISQNIFALRLRGGHLHVSFNQAFVGLVSLLFLYGVTAFALKGTNMANGLAGVISTYVVCLFLYKNYRPQIQNTK